MSLFQVFNVAGGAMHAQSVRLNVTASNLANAGNVHGDPDQVYRARQPVFAASGERLEREAGIAGVRVRGIVESSAPLKMLHQPEHPDADENGNVWVSNVNTVEEMVNMMSASRSYRNGVELINTAKELLLQTLAIGR